jgi:hypothetical protein
MDRASPCPPSGWGPLPRAPTVDEAVLLRRVDAGQVARPAAAVPFRVLPRPTMGEISVAVALDLVPASVTAFRVWEVDRDGYEVG